MAETLRCKTCNGEGAIPVGPDCGCPPEDECPGYLEPCPDCARPAPAAASTATCDASVHEASALDTGDHSLCPASAPGDAAPREEKRPSGSLAQPEPAGSRQSIGPDGNRALDPFLVHELLHGASLAMDMLERVGSGEVYAPVWLAHPAASRAYDTALYAVMDFYQEMGVVSCAVPAHPFTSEPNTVQPEPGPAAGDNRGGKAS